MNDINLKDIGPQSYDTTKETIRLGLKALQSDKYRLKKMKDEYPIDRYEAKMAEILMNEQVLKEMRNFLTPKKIGYREMTREMIDKLTIDEINHGVKSLQSQKFMNKYNEPMRLEIETSEKMFIERREVLKGLESSTGMVKKSKIENLLESLSLLSKDDKIMEMERRLKELIGG